MTDPKTKAPEPKVGSGDPSSPVAGAVNRPAPAEGVSPEVVDANESASAGPPEFEEQEPEAAAVDEVDVAALSARAEKADEYLDLAQRTRAEFENYRKRAVREAAAAQERGAAKLALELLPAIDNLDRALEHASNGDASFVSGIKHVRSDVLAALKRSGIEPFSPDGEAFDPQMHEAIAQRPFEGAEPGTVVEVYQRGYRLGESILRPARVVVAG
jgi:molecular chaperone GrpE